MPACTRRMPTPGVASPGLASQSFAAGGLLSRPYFLVPASSSLRPSPTPPGLRLHGSLQLLADGHLPSA